MNNKGQSPNIKKFDLEERTGKFGEEVVRLAKKIPQNTVTTPLINQFIKSGTSVGANYCEADGAESGKDFYHKIAICKKEAKEAKHWLRILATAVPEIGGTARGLWQEAQELTLIFSSIISGRNKKKR